MTNVKLHNTIYTKEGHEFTCTLNINVKRTNVKLHDTIYTKDRNAVRLF